MTEGLSADDGQADTTPGMEPNPTGQVSDAPELGTAGQPDVNGQAEETVEIPDWLPAPENWEQMTVDQKQSFKDQSAYWQTAVNGIAEKYKTESEKDHEDAEMFRKLATDEQFRQQAISSLGWVPSANGGGGQGSQASTSSPSPSLDDIDLYDKDQVVNLIKQQAEAIAESKINPLMERYQQDQQRQQLLNEFNGVKAKHSDAEKYVGAIDQILSSGRAISVSDAYKLAKLDEAENKKRDFTLPAFGVDRSSEDRVPPNQVPAATNQTVPTGGGEGEDFSGLSSYQIAQKLAEQDATVQRSLQQLEDRAK